MKAQRFASLLSAYCRPADAARTVDPRRWKCVELVGQGKLYQFSDNSSYFSPKKPLAPIGVQTLPKLGVRNIP